MHIHYSVIKKEAHLSPRDHVTCCVSWDLVNCCTTVWKIAFRM